MAATHCYSLWRWWFDTLWLTLIRVRWDSLSLCYFLFCWNWQDGYLYSGVVKFHLQLHSYVCFSCFFSVGCGFIDTECQIYPGFYLIYWKTISLVMWVNQSQVWSYISEPTTTGYSHTFACIFRPKASFDSALWCNSWPVCSWFPCGM
jgi:hypothetical protein